MTALKAYFAHQNVQNHNPTLFKKINDLALKTKFEGELNKEEFQAIFLNHELLGFDIANPK